MNQFFGTLALKPAEQLLNHLIAKDTHVAHQVGQFSGQVLEIHCVSPIAATLTIRFNGSTLRLGAVPTSTLHINANATIQGSASKLVSALTARHEKPLADPGLTISGDALFVQDLLATLRTLDVDWRDLLGPFAGDFGVNELDEAGQKLHIWGNQAQANLSRSVKDYLQDEIQWVPDPSEVERFDDQLDQLKLVIDRLRVKTLAFQEKLDKSLKNQHLSD